MVVRRNRPYTSRQTVQQHHARQREMAAIIAAANQPLFHGLMRQAHSKAKTNTPELAVVNAHAAVEICTSSVFTDLLELKGVGGLADAILKEGKTTCPSNDNLRGALDSLTSSKITDLKCWASFKKSKKLRNDIVHLGKKCSEADAQNAILVAQELIDYLVAALAKAQQDD